MEAAPHPWPALGVLLLRDGFVTTDDLEEILSDQRDSRKQRISGWRLGEILIERGTVTADQIAKLVAEQYELPFIELEGVAIDPKIAGRLPDELVERFSALPIEMQPDGSLLLAVADPSAVLFSDELRRAVGMPLRFAVAAPAALKAVIVSARAEAADMPPSDSAWPVQEFPTLDLIRTSEGTSGGGSPVSAVGSPATMPTPTWPPLGTLLVRDGLVSEDELETALAQQRLSSNKRLGEILVERGAVTRTDVARIVAEQYELPFIDLAPAELDVRIAGLLPLDLAQRFSALPVRFEPDGSLLVAVADPTKMLDPEEILETLGARLTFAVADPDAIEQAILRQRLGHTGGEETPTVGEIHVEEASTDLDPSAEEVIERDSEDSADVRFELPDEDTEPESTDDPSALVEGAADISWLEDGLVPAVAGLVLHDVTESAPATEPAELEPEESLLDALDPGGVPTGDRAADPPTDDVVEAEAVAQVEDAVDPEHDMAPEAFPALEVAPGPPHAAEPEQTGKPVHILEPEQTSESVHVHEPEPTAELEPLAEPEHTIQSEGAIEPEQTAEPERTAEPEFVTEPEHAIDPEDAGDPDGGLVAYVELAGATEAGNETGAGEEGDAETVAELDTHVEPVADDLAQELVHEPGPSAEDSPDAELEAPPSSHLSLAPATPEPPEADMADEPVTAADDVEAGPELAVVPEPESAATGAHEPVLLDHESTPETGEPEPDVVDEIVELETPGAPGPLDAEPSALDLVVTMSVPEAVADDHVLPVLAYVEAEREPAPDGDIEHLLERARTFGATSIHFSAQPDGLVVRARVDGRLRELELLTSEDRVAAERELRRLARDERPDLDVRLLPTRNGTSVTVHLHSAREWAPTLTDLHMAPEDEKALRSALDEAAGLVLVVGPGGSGRTTTLYAALAELHTPDRALVTVERRMHRTLPGVDQVAIDPRFGPSLARGLLPALGADPDAVLVDEIADAETALLAVEGGASRLVLASILAPSARAAVRRLVDLGVSPAALASSVTAIVTQRLVRRICTDCRESYYASAEELAELGRPEEEAGRRLLGRSKGCPTCERTGFRGHAGLFSLAVPSDEVSELASNGASPAKIEGMLAASATHGLHDDGVRLCLDGITTVAELRAAGLVDD